MAMSDQWQAIRERLSDAKAAREIMHSRTADAKDRDLATDRYVTAVDALVLELSDDSLIQRVAALLGPTAATGGGRGV